MNGHCACIERDSISLKQCWCGGERGPNCPRKSWTIYGLTRWNVRASGLAGVWSTNC